VTAAEIAEIAHARPYRDEYRGPCPVHGGKSGTAFEVKEGEGGRTLIKCWRGCPKADILRALGLGWVDLFGGPRQPRPEDALDLQTRPAVDRAKNKFRHHPVASRTDEPLTVLVTDADHMNETIARALALAVEGELVQVALENASATDR
jgi:hypothetical protein